MNEVGKPVRGARGGRKLGASKAPASFVPPVVGATALAAVQVAEVQAANAVARTPAPESAAEEIVAPVITAADDAAATLVETVAETPAEAARTIDAAAEMPAPTPIAPTAQIQEGLVDMATIAPNMTDTAAQATEKMQTVFGDMGQRFKTSFEKSSKLGEEMVELAKGNVEAVVASARVAAKGGEVIGQDAAEYTKKSFESAVAAMKSFASVKSPTELFQLQSEFAKASFDSAVAEASRFSESMMKLAGDVAQPLSSRYAVAAEKIKSATL